MAITPSTNPTLLNWISPQEISASIERVKSVNAENYGTHVINEITSTRSFNPIGSIKVVDKEIFVTFRGSLGLEFLSLASTHKIKCHEFGFSAEVHQGLHQNFNTFKPNLSCQIQAIIQRQGMQLNEVKLTAEGYSRGGGFATLTAAMAHQLGIQKVGVLTYAAIGVFNEEGANNYQAAMGKENHLSFKVSEDPIPVRWGTGAGFAQLGTPIEFSVKEMPEYKARMQLPYLTHIAQNPFAQMGVSLIFKKEEWEGHMIESYEHSVSAFQKYKTSLT